MKKITILLLCGTLSIISCKKEKDTPITPAAPVSFGSVVVTTINDTVDFSTTGNSYDWSKGMDFDSIHTDIYSSADYAVESNDSNFFNNKKALSFNAGHDCKLFLDDNLGGWVKKYSQGQTINYNTVSNSGSSSTGIVSGLILKEGAVSNFHLNETFYLGTAFLHNGSYYNGWVKVKTLNNYYSCIIISYGVCKTANTPITAG